MLTQEDYWMIKELHERGLYRKDIADRLGVHPKTVTRALKKRDAPSRRRRRQKYLKLKPYLGKVDELLAAGVYNAVVIYREIQALGYTGRIRELRSYIEPKRALLRLRRPRCGLRRLRATSCSTTGASCRLPWPAFDRRCISRSTPWGIPVAFTSWPRGAATPSTPTRA